MYLWDIEIETIPLGWDEEYQKAMKLYPHGITYTSNDTNDHNFRDPVGYRQRLIEMFTFYSRKAKQVVSNGPLRDQFHELLLWDIRLFNVLIYWLSPSPSFDPGEFDTDEIDRFMDIPDYYYECDNDAPDYAKRFASYRIVRIAE